MTADSKQELHAFAAALRIARCWYHVGAAHPHYDVTDAQRERAISMGAIAVTQRELARKARRCVTNQRDLFRSPDVL